MRRAPSTDAVQRGRSSDAAPKPRPRRKRCRPRPGGAAPIFDRQRLSLEKETACEKRPAFPPPHLAETRPGEEPGGGAGPSMKTGQRQQQQLARHTARRRPATKKPCCKARRRVTHPRHAAQARRQAGDATRKLTTQDRAAQSSGARLSPTELRRLARLMFQSRRRVAGARRLLERPLARPAAVEKTPRAPASDTYDLTP